MTCGSLHDASALMAAPSVASIAGPPTYYGGNFRMTDNSTSGRDDPMQQLLSQAKGEMDAALWWSVLWMIGMAFAIGFSPYLLLHPGVLLAAFVPWVAGLVWIGALAKKGRL